MNMDGTMGRKRSTKTWAEPWYEYEYENEDEDAHRKTRAKPWKDEHDDTMGKRMDEHGRNHGTKTHANSQTHGRNHGTRTRTKIHTNARKNLQTHNNVPWPHFFPAAPEKEKAENEYSEI